MKSSICFLTIVVALFSCSVDEPIMRMPPQQASNPPVCNDDAPHHPSFYIDSAAWTDDTSVTIWAHMRYDSVLIIQYQSVETWAWYHSQELSSPDNEWIGHVIISEPDTIDFRLLKNSVLNCAGRKEWINSFSVLIHLSKDYDYWIKLDTRYTERGIEMTDVEYLF